MSTRAQLTTSLDANIKSGNSDTTAANVRTFEADMIASCVNKTDDADAEGGFLQINSGRVDVSKINSPGVSVSNTCQILQGDGTWRSAVSGKYSADGNGVQTTFNVASGGGFIPQSVIASAGGPDSAKPFYTNNYNPSGFDVVFLAAPTSGTGNVIINFYMEG